MRNTCSLTVGAPPARMVRSNEPSLRASLRTQSPGHRPVSSLHAPTPVRPSLIAAGGAREEEWGATATAIEADRTRRRDGDGGGAAEGAPRRAFPRHRQAAAPGAGPPGAAAGGRRRAPSAPRTGRPAPSAAFAASAGTFAAGAARPLLRTVPSPYPANPWQFQLMAGLQSSTHAREELAHAPPASHTISKEYLASMEELDDGIQDLEENLKQLDYLWWMCVALLLYIMVFVLPEQVPKLLDLRRKNSEIASKIRASMQSVEELNNEIAYVQAELEDLEQQHAKLVSVVPSAVVPSSGIADV